MNYQKILFTVFACVLLMDIKAQQIHSLWLKPNVTVDGNPDEWPQPFRYYDGGTKLQFAFANDSTNVYVCLKITDEATQVRIFRGGLNVWIDPKGKKKETEGVGFPMKLDRMSESFQKHKKTGEEPDPGAQRSDVLRLKQHVMMEQITLRIKGFTGLPEQVLQLQNNPVGINAALNWDSLNILCIEYKIPIQVAIGHQLTSADTLNTIGIGLVEPSLETPGGRMNDSEHDVDMSRANQGMRDGYNGGMNGQQSMGGYGGRGGGMGGGGMNRSMSESNPSSQEQKTWSKVNLSFSK